MLSSSIFRQAVHPLRIRRLSLPGNIKLRFGVLSRLHTQDPLCRNGECQLHVPRGLAAASTIVAGRWPVRVADRDHQGEPCTVSWYKPCKVGALATGSVANVPPQATGPGTLSLSQRSGRCRVSHFASLGLKIGDPPFDWIYIG